MVSAVNQTGFSSIQDQGNSRQLPVDRQQSAAQALTQTSQTTQNQQNQALTVRPVPSPGANNETTRATDSKDARRRPTQNPASSSSTQLSEAELRQVQELRARDREVRAHEQAHLAAAGGLARGGPSFSTVRGPDGQQYAVGGEVPITTSSGSSDPQERIAHAQQVRRAALAPANPSAQDRAVAAQASIAEAEARAELTQQQVDEVRETLASDSGDETGSAQGDESVEQTFGSANRPEAIYQSIQSLNPEESEEGGLSVFA